jgi:Cdc6-like AAA superfamily ATPase
MKWLYDDYKCKITPVLIVNIPYGTLKKYFEEDTLSRMSWDLGNFINFPYYSFQEMYNILRQRAEEALEPDTWEPEAISQITKYGVEQNDLRRAIDILRDACTMFPDEHLITDHALAMIKQAGVYSISQDLDNLPLHARLYLLSLLMQETRFSHSTKGVPHSAVDNTFRDMCKNLEINQPSISTIWRLRKILETQEYLKRTTDRFIQYTPMGAKTPGSATYLTLNMESFVLINAFKKCEWSEFYDPEIGRKLTASL